jgi:monovalent cation:H+ antiporter-2, CPA2 family
MQIPLLTEIVAILAVSIATLLVCIRLRIPEIVGLLLAGVLAGPHGLALVHSAHEVEMLAEIGVVLLLFAIGIEFSLGSLLKIRRAVLFGGSLQVGLTILAVVGLSHMGGNDLGPALLMGFLISLSSTAIVMRMLQERAEIDSPHGRAALGILIFQDLAIVPMMLATPYLAGGGGEAAGSLPLLALKIVAVVLLLGVGQKGLPWLLHQVARARSRELFLLCTVGLCLAVAWLTSIAGLSLGLGAFLAGLLISESEYSHDALGGILPFRDVFTSFFFVSIGMLLDLGFLLREPLSIVLVTAAILLLKGSLAAGAAVLLGLPLRSALLVGFALCQVGEFSFVLSKIALKHDLLTGESYQLFLATSVLSMAATPFVMRLAPHLAGGILRLPLPEKLKLGLGPPEATEETAKPLRDHIVIIGFGMNGRNVARAARATGIPHVILEMNPETVRAEKAQGRPILYGDATHEAVLEHVRVRDARVVVLGISDPAATRRVTELVRRHSSKVHLIVRTRYIQEMQPLYELGANDVIPEEFETSVEIFTRVLLKYLIPKDRIESFIAEIRADGYEMFRSWRAASTSISDLRLHLDDVEICKLQLAAGAPLDGMTLAETELRKRHGVTLLAIRRAGQTVANPDAATRLGGGDSLYLMGSPQALGVAAHLFRAAPQGLGEPAGRH